MNDARSGPESLHEPLILLVDETEFFLKIQHQFLRNSAVRVQTLSQPSAVVAVVRENRPALIFLDRGAPSMAGVACCRTLKTDPDLRQIPVVLICAGSDPGEALLCRQAGCDELLTKPLNRDAFLAAGRKFLPALDQLERRVLCYATVFFKGARGSHYGKAVDLSAGGIFIETEQRLPIGERIDLSFALPNAGARLLELKGRVSWCNDRIKPFRSNYPTGFGVEFIDPPTDVQTGLRHFVAEHSTHQEKVRSQWPA